MSALNDQDRQDWIKGKPPGDQDDDFARMAARGRQELPDAAAAEDLLRDLDRQLAERYQGKTPDQRAATPATEPGGTSDDVPPFAGRIRSLRRLYAIAAALLLLVAAGYWWATSQRVADGEALYAAAFSPYANEISQRTMGETVPEDTLVNPTLAAGLLAYDRENFAVAADSLAVYLNSAPASAPGNQDPAGLPDAPLVTGARLYYGISLLAANRPTAARAELRDLIGDPRYGDAARWYTALAFLRTNETASARPLLESLSTDANSLFRERATELVATLP